MRLRAGLLAGLAAAGAAHSGAAPAALLQAAPAATAGAPHIVLDGPTVQGGVVAGKAPAGTTAISLDGKPVRIDRDGRFIIGFDRDQAPFATLVAKLADGRTVTRPLQVAPRRWPVEHVRVARRPTASTEEFLRIRARELARIGAARSRASESSGWRQRFRWPAAGRVSGRFGSQRIYRGEPGAYHSGVDVAAGAGAPVAAPADGVVVLAGPPTFSLEGNLVIIDHGMGLNSAFLHLATSAVREGQAVRQGQLIGTVGASGRATGPHLHWSMKWNAARIDPEALAGPMR
ncbi:MAG TPA: M23 family metallopeptidase [Allosphingosinicella sp.]|nr:M23 family metallopeptidase [Allosphingosinicella sp.]